MMAALLKKKCQNKYFPMGQPIYLLNSKFNADFESVVRFENIRKIEEKKE